jgi:acyl-CoA thioesterase
MSLRFDDDLRAVVDLPHAPHLNHALGQVHGGVFATLVDTAAWFTAAVHYETWLATVEFETRLLTPVDGEDLIATGSLIRAGSRIATASAEVRTASGVVAAVGTGSFALTGLPTRVAD